MTPENSAEILLQPKGNRESESEKLIRLAEIVEKHSVHGTYIRKELEELIGENGFKTTSRLRKFMGEITENINPSYAAQKLREIALEYRIG